MNFFWRRVFAYSVTLFNASHIFNKRIFRYGDSKLDEIEACDTNTHGFPISHPRNTTNFRYILAERDPLATPAWNAFDCRIAFPPSGCLYRPVVPERVLLSLHDSAAQLRIQDNQLTVTGHKGYCTARATHFVNRGRWYFEVNVLEVPQGAAVRLGWSQQYSNLQAPVGFDNFGYCWRSLKGTRFHAGHGKSYGQSYKEGDILGFFIELPEYKNRSYLLDSYKDRYLIKYDGLFYYEIKQCPGDLENALTVLPGSTIEFFKNGYSEGVAFTEIYEGAYFPSISLYKEAKVKVNFGPHFAYAHVLEDYEARAFSERGLELVIEQYFSNLLNLIVASEQITTLQVIEIC